MYILFIDNKALNFKLYLNLFKIQKLGYNKTVKIEHFLFLIQEYILFVHMCMCLSRTLISHIS